VETGHRGEAACALKSRADKTLCERIRMAAGNARGSAGSALIRFRRIPVQIPIQHRQARVIPNVSRFPWLRLAAELSPQFGRSATW